MGKKKNKNRKPRPTPLALMDDGVITVIAPDGVNVVQYSYNAPTAEQLAHFARGSQHRSPVGKLNAVYDLLEDIFDDEAYDEIDHRLRDRTDPLTLETLFPAVRELFSERAGFPTQPPSASSGSSNTTGRRSTGRVPAVVLTPESSPQTVSSTSPSSGVSNG